MGINLLPGEGKKWTPIWLMIVIIVFFLGCASQNAANVRTTEPKQITDIIISETSNDLIFSIVGNQSLNHTQLKQTDPLGVLIYFSDTSLAGGSTYYQAQDNEIITFVKADEVTEDGRRFSRIFIALKKDTPHNLIPSEMELKIVFTKTAAPMQNIDSHIKPAEKKPPPKPEPTTIIPAATRLKTVTAKPYEENLTVTIKADGTIKNYKSFTIEKPPRIVFDLYNVKSPFTKEQKIAVETKWVKQIRYFGHPEKLRLVLETRNGYLSKYSSVPTNTGLQIHIGESD